MHQRKRSPTRIRHPGTSRTSRTSRKKSKARRSKKKEEEESEESYDEEESDVDTSDNEKSYDDDDDEENSDEEHVESNKSNFNIVLTIGNTKYDNELTDDEEYTDSEENYSSEDEDDNETDDESAEVCEHDGEGEKSTSKTTKSSKASSFTNEDAISKFKLLINGLTKDEKENEIVKKFMNEFKQCETKHEKTIVKKTKTIQKKNTSKFQKLLKQNNVLNDTAYFKNKITPDEQEIILKQIAEINNHSIIDKPYRLALLDSDIPIAYKACAYRKINTLKYMEPGGGEYYKIKNWVDTFMQIPFGKYKSLPLTIDDGIEKTHEFMSHAKGILDEAVYGLDDAKLQIMQFVGQWIANPDAIGTSIAIKGPMGTGKTTLVKEGISKILGRDFAFIALGGATDSSFLEGHSYTYEGSMQGKIVDILIQSKNMNPVIYFDELDKLSDTPKGEELAGILTHLTDTSQNSKYHDKYFAEIDFDLSRCLFIFSYNDESKINPILLDRMYRIQTKGYDKKEKTTIANDYLLPKIRDQVKFNVNDITIPEETLHHIIDNYTDKESGVRNLKRCLEIIYTKLNLYRLMKPGTNLFEKDMELDITFPVTLTVEMLGKIIKKTIEGGSWHHMYT